MSEAEDDPLVAFFTARLDEEETTAKAAAGGPWTGSGPYVGAAGAGIIMQARHSEDAAHVARHDPARVLRDVEADRAILAMLEQDFLYGPADDYQVAEALGLGRPRPWLPPIPPASRW